MSVEENVAQMKRVYEAFSSGDLHALDELVVPQFVDHNPEPDQGPGLQGVKDTEAKFRAVVPDLNFTVEDVVAEGDKVVVRAIMNGTDQGGLFPGISASGKRFSVEVIDIFRLQDGKAVERWGIYDGVTLLEQIGAISMSAHA